MSTAINAQLTGTFTSDGTAFDISIPSGYTEIELTNLSFMGSTAGSTPVMKAWGYSELADGEGIFATKTNGAATIAIPTTVATNGFTFLTDSGLQTPGAPTAISGITNAAPPVVSTGSTTGLADFDIVRVYGTTGQLNIAGLDFTIDNLIANTSFELIYMGAPGAAATAGFWRRIPFDARFYPVTRTITSISQATSAVIVMSVTHGYTVGQEVRINVPAEFGMVEMNGLLATITAINTTTNSITVDVDSTGFTAFAFPTSALAATGVSFAQVVPVGESATVPYANLLDDATRNQSITGVTVGTSMQTSGSVYQWVARKGQAI